MAAVKLRLPPAEVSERAGVRRQRRGVARRDDRVQVQPSAGRGCDGVADLKARGAAAQRAALDAEVDRGHVQRRVGWSSTCTDAAWLNVPLATASLLLVTLTMPAAVPG